MPIKHETNLKGPTITAVNKWSTELNCIKHDRYFIGEKMFKLTF